MARSKHSKFWWLLLLFAGIFAILATSFPPKDLIPWQSDYTKASVEARTDHKLILLDFYADWCGPCKAMAADTWTDKHVAKAVSGYVPVHVNVDDNPELSQHFGVQGIPYVLLVDGSGNVVAQHVGQMEPDDFMLWLHNAGKPGFADVGQ